jgi:hypothetical protein
VRVLLQYCEGVRMRTGRGPLELLRDLSIDVPDTS